MLQLVTAALHHGDIREGEFRRSRHRRVSRTRGQFASGVRVPSYERRGAAAERNQGSAHGVWCAVTAREARGEAVDANASWEYWVLSRAGARGSVTEGHRG